MESSRFALCGNLVGVQSENNDVFGELVAKIESGRHRHIVFLIGSAVSYFPPSNCASVGEVRDEGVFDGLHEFAVERANLNDEVFSRLQDVTCLLRSDSEAETKPHLRTLVEDLAFEQFMGCVHAAEPNVAFDLIRLACGTNQANGNHAGLVQASEAILEKGYADRITLLTTNYDQCIEDTLKPEKWPEANKILPSFVRRYASGKEIQLIKLHGCLSQRDTLVFAFSQMSKLIWKPERLEKLWKLICADLQAPQLFISVGYGFNDPDLRPMLKKWMASDGNCIVINRRPGEQDRIISGPEVLKSEFLIAVDSRRNGKDGRITTHHSQLCEHSDGRLSLAVRLAHHFCGNAYAAWPKRKADEAKSQFAEDAKRIVKRLQPHQALHFVASLVNACSTFDANLVSALRAFLSNQKHDAEDLPVLAEYYVRQFGHRHDMQSASNACEWLKEEFSDPSIRAIAFAYRSFAVSLARPSSNSTRWWAQAKARFTRIANVAVASCTLFRGAKYAARAKTGQQVFFNHYRDHFWVKLSTSLLEFADKCPLWIRKWAQFSANRVLAHNQGTMRFARDQAQLELATSAQSLEAELLIALKSETALVTTEAVRSVRMCYGTLNETILAERAKGWAELTSIKSKSNESNRLGSAIGAFARGAKLALVSSDESLKWKLTANLVRVLYAHDTKQFETDWKAEEPSPLLDDRPLCSVADLYSESERSAEFMNTRRRIVSYLKHLYRASPEAICRSIISRSDVKQYPLYSPPTPIRPEDFH